MHQVTRCVSTEVLPDRERASLRGPDPHGDRLNTDMRLRLKKGKFMPITTIDANAAIIVIDMQKGIAGYPMLHPLSAVVAQINSLAEAFRRLDLPVVLVVAAGSSPGRTEHSARGSAPIAPDATELLPELSQGPDDHRIAKHARGAFSGTGLEQYLKDKGITQVVVVGIATSNGVESTARQAFEAGFNVTLAIDAMSDGTQEAHDHSITRIFPRLGETGTTEDIVKRPIRHAARSPSRLCRSPAMLPDKMKAGPMNPRRLGRSDLMIAPLVLGCNMFGWTADPRTSFEILDRFVGAGFNALDTADVYSAWVPGHGGGESEKIIGDWLRARGSRAQIILQTKVGATLPDGGKGLSAAHIVRAAEASLTRLRTDYIDLYQAHTDDPSVPLEETLEAFHQLIEAGKVRAIGASHYSTERLIAALETSKRCALPRYDTVQPRYNLYDRADYDGALQQACLANDVGVLCYSTLAKGFLTDDYQDSASESGSAWGALIRQRYVNARGARVRAALRHVSQEQGARLAEVALAWVASQPGVAAPIVGVESVEQLDDVLRFTRVTLDRGQLEALTQSGEMAKDAT
jgi:aryl-alcohol dehydrogenase-like predicted oxidoreductase/nicotinamidase-related amidase